MPKIPMPNDTATPSGKSGVSTVVSPDYYVRDDLAKSQFFDTVTREAVRWGQQANQINAAAKVSKFQNDLQEGWNMTVAEMEQDNDPDKYPQYFEAFKQGMESRLEQMQGPAKQIAANKLNRDIGQYQGRMESFKRGRQKDNLLSEYERAVESLKKDEFNPGTVLEEISERIRQSGIWSDEEAAARLENDIYAVNLERTLNESLSMPLKDAVDYIKDSPLTEDDKRKVESNVRHQERMRQEDLEAQNAETRLDLLKRSASGVATPREIELAVAAEILTPGQGVAYQKLLLPPDIAFTPITELSKALKIQNAVALGKPLEEAEVELSALNLTRADREKFVAEIHKEHDIALASIIKNARSRMEEIIREKDPFSGAFTDDERQQIAAAEADVELTNLILDMVAKGKQINEDDLIKQAIDKALIKKMGIVSDENNNRKTAFNPKKVGQPKNISEFMTNLKKFTDADDREGFDEYWNKWLKTLLQQ